ncbi:MAG TPA: response regulator transcription factor [Thermoanaerobaculia bacterium]|nr:response regulator transcription factor [Thermoanaerobaculia bacterium]
MAITLLLADDHQLVRQSLISLLEHEGFEVVGEASDGRTAVRLVQELNPEIAVLDMVMPGLNGIDAARQIQRASPRTKSILVTMYSERQYVVQALRAGIRGYVLKSQGARDLIQAIREVHNGAVYLSPKVSELAVDLSLGRAEAEADPLSPREREVVQLIAEGLTTKEVASVLGISVKTAEAHRINSMRKLDVHETASLVRYAVRQGLVQP